MASNAQTVLLPPEMSIRRYENLLRATTAIAGYRDIRTFRERFASEHASLFNGSCYKALAAYLRRHTSGTRRKLFTRALPAHS